jgi:hypothetical protein
MLSAGLASFSPNVTQMGQGRFSPLRKRWQSDSVENVVTLNSADDDKNKNNKIIKCETFLGGQH